MKTLPDITSRADIELFVNRFYEKVQQDDLISFFFTQVVPVDFPAHLPRMYDFWESIVLGTGNYKGEPMTAHIQLNKKHPMEPAHFERWLQLFHKTIDENFAGPKSAEIKMRSAHIAKIIQLKINQ